MSKIVRCLRPGCNKPLPIQFTHAHNLSVALFPENLLGCLVHLTYGPTIIPCPRCGHRNDIADGGVWIVNRKREAIAYVADRLLVNETKEGLEQNLGKDFAVNIVQDVHAYRTAVISRFIAPRAAAVLNDAVLDPRGVGPWVRDN